MASHTHRSILTRSFENTLRIVHIWRLQFVGLPLHGAGTHHRQNVFCDPPIRFIRGHAISARERDSESNYCHKEQRDKDRKSEGLSLPPQNESLAEVKLKQGEM